MLLRLLFQCLDHLICLDVCAEFVGRGLGDGAGDEGDDGFGGHIRRIRIPLQRLQLLNKHLIIFLECTNLSLFDIKLTLNLILLFPLRFHALLQF